ncbi:zinc finger, CCHC-type containing protein [Tanacetum coccineum]
MTGKKNKEIGSATSFQCPMLNNSNFNVWAIRMQVILEANDLWEVVEPQPTTQIDNKADKTAIAFIFQALPEDQILQVAKHKSARTVWDALKTRHVGENRVQQAKQQTLKAEFEALQMKENESVDSFISKISSTTSRATNVGLTFEDSTLVRKLLTAVPDTFLHIVASIEQYSNLDNMSLDEAIGRLKTFEERLKCKKERQPDSQERLMSDKKNRESSQNNFKKDKRKFNPEEDQSNLIEEDLEPTLLMATIEEHHEVFLNERNFEPPKTSPGEESLWYLDNGASNHMIGVKEHFKEIDEKITGNIQFGDGSYVEIKGKVNRERLQSSNGIEVYTLYDSNDNIHFRVYDRESKNRLYKANLRIGEPTCLLANLHDEAWLWHARLGHLNFRSLKSMTTKNLVKGIPSIKHSTDICDICLIGKHARAPFPQQAEYRSKTVLDLIYGDLYGPI